LAASLLDEDSLPPNMGGPAHPAVTGGMSNIANALLALPQQTLQASEGLRQTGQYSPAPAMDLAMALAGGGTSFAQKGAAGIFGGRLAKTADQSALSMAEQMAERGMDRKQIWDATGWFKGADGKWKFEIPDDTAKLTLKGNPNNPDLHGQGPLNTILSHPDLFDAYPGLGKIESEIADSSLLRPWGIYRYNHRPIIGGQKIEARGGEGGPLQTKQVALHEVQHGVQIAEGFAEGSHPSRLRDVAIRAGTPADKIDEAIYEAYRRHAGEVEARNVENRMQMTPDERRKFPPWVTQDIPDEQQIVRLPSWYERFLR
jgi:hypothetical protein